MYIFLCLYFLENGSKFFRNENYIEIVFRKSGIAPRKSKYLSKNRTITIDILENHTARVSTFHLQKCEFFDFCQKKDHQTTITVLVPHFVTKKIGRQLSFSSLWHSFFQKSSDQHFGIAVLINIVEKSSNGPASPWGEGCKLQNLSSVYTYLLES